jgi:hypothetical protein
LVKLFRAYSSYCLFSFFVMSEIHSSFSSDCADSISFPLNTLRKTFNLLPICDGKYFHILSYYQCFNDIDCIHGKQE